MKSNLIMLLCLLAAIAGFSQDENLPKPELTEVWEPVPKIVEPSAKPGDPPSDAIILFNGKNLDEWISPKEPNGPAQWTLADGVITVKKGTGPIRTKRSFTDFQFHLEYRIPANITGSGQARGNSGIFFAAPPATVTPDTNYRSSMVTTTRPMLMGKWEAFTNNLFPWLMLPENLANGKLMTLSGLHHDSMMTDH